MSNSILIHSPMGYTGYGVVGWNIAKTFHANATDTTVFPIGASVFNEIPNMENESDKTLLEQMVNKSFDPTSPCLKIWHQFDLALRIGKGKYVAFPFFEVDKLNEREIIHLNIPDHLIVSSDWAKQVLIQNNIKVPISVAPLAVDINTFDDSLNKTKKPEDPYVFIMIGKWEIRKGYDVLLEVFEKAFDENSNVELWLLGSSDKTCFTQKEMDDWHSFYKSSKLSSKIKIFPRLKTQKDVANVISQADCGIFLNRAEGWNLDLLEVMSMNKPVITTNYSAHTEFCNHNNSYLINIDSLEPAYDGKWFFGQGNWAHIGQNQKDQAIEHMRAVVRENVRTNEEGKKTGQTLSWKNTIKHIQECII
jgi:glycosyltransferase involved in cell wall biosynthesis